MQIRPRQVLLVALLTFLLLLAGCAQQAATTSAPGAPAASSQTSLQATALKTLQTNQVLYDTTFKTLALLDSQGKLPAATKAKAISLGNTYMAVHNAAVQAILNNQPVSLQTVSDALNTFLQAAAAAGVK